VLSVDEMSQVQALDRTQPILPLRPGLPERQTHDSIRHGTTTLFAALNVLDGKVIATRHRHTEFLQFLDQIERQTQAADGASDSGQLRHAHPSEGFRVVGGPSAVSVSLHAQGGQLAQRSGATLCELTRQRIRGGTFRSVREVEKAIQDYVRAHNHRVCPFVWTAIASKIIRKVRPCKEALVTGHQLSQWRRVLAVVSCAAILNWWR